MTKVLSIILALTMTSLTVHAGKCSGVGVNDCSTFSDPFKDQSKQCKNAYKRGVSYGGWVCGWTSYPGNGGECLPTTKACN